MQMNLDSISVAGRTIALPVPTTNRVRTVRRTIAPATRPGSELERLRQEALDGSGAERIVWLILALSAVALLSLSLWV